MSIEGFVDYKRREYCNAVQCPVQVQLNSLEEGSEEYEKVRKTCRENCKFTAWHFHHWLMDNGFLVVKPEK